MIEERHVAVLGTRVTSTAQDAASGLTMIETQARPIDLPRISVVIPARNEERNLPHVLVRIPHYVHEVILVDGHSTDRTVEVARALWPDVRIVQQTGRGKGDALACGFAACTGNIVVMLDADGSMDPLEIPRFIDHLRGGADFVKGSRYLPGGGSSDLTHLRNAGNWGLNRLTNTLHGTRYTDLCYGYNAFWTDHLPLLDVDCDGFEVETLMNIRAARAGLQVREVPSFEDRRLYGESSLRTFRDGFRVVRTIGTEFLAGLTGDVGTDVAPGKSAWDGQERRSGRDRRGDEDRRANRTSAGRRRTAGRRWTDLYASQPEWLLKLGEEMVG